MPLRRASADVEDRVTREQPATAPDQELPPADSRPLSAEPPTIEIPRIPAPSAPAEPDEAGQSVADLLSAVATALAAEDGEPAAEPAAPQPAQPAADQPAADQPKADQPAADQPAADQPAADQPKAGFRAPGLDGVRALAVLSVLFFHEGLPWIHGGFLGVDIFFVLSGYLITDLLAVRFGKTGKIGLGTFYQRRARRLLPPLALMLVIVTAAVVVLEPQQRAALRPALLGAVTYTSNWWQAFAHLSYFQQYGPPPPLQHLWSLAVEEQFYLIWPLILALVLLAIRKPVLRSLVAWAGAAASAYAVYAIYVPAKDPSLVYYGTDTHASGLMIGAALALTFPLAKVATAAKKYLLPLDIAGLIGLLALAWMAWDFSGSDRFVYPYGLVLAGLAAGALVLAATAPGRIGRALSVPPLRWLGVRSYGIYLWHWPVIAITTGIAERSAATAQARIIDAVLPIGLAAVSWRWLEEPILHNGLRSELSRRLRLLRLAITIGWRKPAALVPLAVAACVLTVACTAGYGILHPPTGPTLEQQIKAGAKIFTAANVPGPAVAAPLTQPDPWWIKGGEGRGPWRPGEYAEPKRHLKVPGTKVIAIGDSVMLASAPELEQALPGIYVNAQVSRAMVVGIAIVQHLARTKRLRPILIVGLGTNGPITLSQIEQLRAAIGDRWLLLINTFVPRSWEHEVNSTMVDAVRRWPNVLMINWHNAIEHHTNLLWSDGIHPMPVGGVLYAKTVRTIVQRALHTAPRLHRRPGPRIPPGDFMLHAAGSRPA